ncbi:hypothetical protein CRG98_031277 [Punica granatum]|nr:hypothetical protein CRG98_031277 [Punica granatum]
MGSKRNWKASLKHAGTCEVGQKRYIFQAFGNSVILDPICRVVSAHINGQACIDELVKTAYLNWDKVKEIDEYQYEH